MNKKTRGFTLVEILATLAATVVLLGMVAMYASRYRDSSTANAFVADVQQLASNIKGHYKGRQDYSGLTTKYALNNGLMPQSLLLGTAWGSALTVFATDIADDRRASDVATPNSGYAISWSMPIKVCSSVLPALLPRVKWVLVGERVIQRPSAMAGTDVQSIRGACNSARLGGAGGMVGGAGGKGDDGKDDGGGSGVGIEPSPIDPSPEQSPGMVVLTLKDG